MSKHRQRCFEVAARALLLALFATPHFLAAQDSPDRASSPAAPDRNQANVSMTDAVRSLQERVRELQVELRQCARSGKRIEPKQQTYVANLRCDFRKARRTRR